MLVGISEVAISVDWDDDGETGTFGTVFTPDEILSEGTDLFSEDTAFETGTVDELALTDGVRYRSSLMVAADAAGVSTLPANNTPYWVRVKTLNKGTGVTPAVQQEVYGGLSGFTGRIARPGLRSLSSGRKAVLLTGLAVAPTAAELHNVTVVLSS